MNIVLKEINDNNIDYKQIYEWCKNKFVYEWFEQRILSLDEITNKYKNKLNNGKQLLFIIKVNNKDIGLIQIYKYENDINISELKKYKKIYEYDLFIGEDEYLSKGIGREVVNKINELIYSKYKADAIVLRPFTRNVRAVKCYEKCGFKLLEEYEGLDTLNNKERISLLINNKNTNNC